MNKQDLHDNFQSIFEELNAQQKEAVDQIYGPVMVIAGPGTGKTQILSARIGNILLKTDVYPDNILCLTYTDAGRVAMRQRLQDMIGADAYRVGIHTFHSFCSQIISDNPSFFNKPALDPLSELERIEILKKLIDNLEADSPLKRFSSKPYLEVKNLSFLFNTIKKEGYAIEFIREQIKAHLNGLTENEAFQYKRKHTDKKAGITYVKGDPNPKLIEAEEKRFEKTLAALDMFEDFQIEMDERNRYDFNDMINWVLNAFEKDKNFLANFKEQYQFILVDEYQDTSGTQNKLIHYLVEDEDQPNIFVVGDDDQSIYRFQGANIDNIYDFQSNFSKDLKEVVLVNNYRSTPAILEAAGQVIKHNSARMVNKDSQFKKDLVASHKDIAQVKIKPTISYYENPFQELIGVAEQVIKLIEEGEEAKNIAVLYKENWLGTEFLSYLKEKNIPYYLKRKEELFDIPLAKKLLNIIRYIAAEREVERGGEEYLSEILHYDLFNIPSHEIVRIIAKVDKVDKVENGGNRYGSLRVYLQDWIKIKNKELFQEGVSKEITDTAIKLEQWIQDSFNIPFTELVEKIMREGNFLQFALNSNEKLWHMEVLRAAMDYVKDETHRNPKHTPETFINTLDLMIEQDINIPMYRVFGTEKGVNLLTVHGSKGLEFKHVFLIQTTSELWESRSIKGKGYKFPDNMLAQDKEDEQVRKLEETRRLFYVALTRAKVGLHLSWAKKDMKEKPTEPSQFIAEITDGLAYERNEVVIDEKIMEEYLNIYLFKNTKPVLETGESDFIEHQLQNFSLSPTALNNYLDCPLKFYYRNIVRVPAGRNEYMAFGSAVHYAIEHCFKKMQQNEEEAFPTVEEVIQDYHWYLNRNKESFTPEALQRRKAYGEKILTEYYNENVSNWNKVVSIEKRYRNVTIADVPVNGMIDKIEFDGKNAVVIDYKTGKSDDANRKTAPPNEKEPNGSNYWRQAMFYKLLVEADPLKDWLVQACVFEFIEPNKKGEYVKAKLIPTAEHLAIVKAQIKDTYEKIMQFDFYTGCGKDDCDTCNFVKESNRYTRLEEVEE